MQVTHVFGGKVYLKRADFDAGAILVQHKHNFDHLSILAAGTVELMVDGVRSVLTGPTELTIAAGKHHGVKALTTGVWYCAHSTDCTDPDEIDHTLIAEDSRQDDMQAMVEELR
jgi:quercetin dioxygenase-like cupin family protein